MRARSAPSTVAVLALAGITFLTVASATRADTVTLPENSVNGLQSAIDQAGPGGTVIVESGLHYESDTVTIAIPVSIVGDPGAVIESETVPAGPPPTELDTALHIRDAEGVTIRGLTLTPPPGAAIGGTAVLVQDSPRALILENTITDYQFGIIVQDGERIEIVGNDITIGPAAAGGQHGIIVVNGPFARVLDNTVSNANFGIWACDLNGRASGNTTTGSFIGLILCKVPPVLIIDGELVGSRNSAEQWQVHNNVATGNFWGYAVTDGANNNVLSNNEASGNFIDIELLGDSTIFGFFTPTCFSNVVAQGTHKDLTIHDCGADNIISGEATLLELPCFE